MIQLYKIRLDSKLECNKPHRSHMEFGMNEKDSFKKKYIFKKTTQINRIK